MCPIHKEDTRVLRVACSGACCFFPPRILVIRTTHICIPQVGRGCLWDIEEIQCQTFTGYFFSKHLGLFHT